MNKKRTSFLSTGIPSMCVIFSVLCLVILALLTLGTSRQDLQSSRLALEQTTAYYTACSTATQQYNKLADFLQSVSGSTEKKEYLSRMDSICEKFPDIKDLTWNADTQTLSFSVSFTEKQAIYLEVNASYPSRKQTTGFTPQILTWKTISTADWNPDTRQPVYTGDGAESKANNKKTVKETAND